MKVKGLVLVVTAGLTVLCLFSSPLFGQVEKKSTTENGKTAQLVGVWEIYQTKSPNKPYEPGYKGRSFVAKGLQAFTLILEYRQDGTFRRLSRIGPSETVQDGTWKFSCNELRQQLQGAREEVLYVRFDNPDQFTSIEVYEDSADPGLFAQFRRVR
ncbi:MAG TPA: hypothetical protein VK463_18365 [Desulfomonilaceae bacterium]|nr:hypothetical protein [Desulfomonilaceae bacterium]